MPTIEKIMTAVSEAIEKALGVSLSDMAIQIGATFILVIIVKIFFWDKITSYLEKRRNLMETEFESAKAANQDAKDSQEKAAKEYHDIKVKSKDYLDKAKQKGEEERVSIINKAKQESSNMMTQAEQEIALEKKKAQGEIRKEVVDLATIMAAKIIEKEIDNSKYQDLVIKNLEGSEKV